MNKWTDKVQFPSDNFILRCTDNVFSQSKSSGNPMVTLEFEVVSPATYNIAGEEYNLAGISISQYFPVTCLNGKSDEENAEKTAANRKRLEALYEQFGLDFSEFNPENPVLEFKGRTVWANMYGKSIQKTKTPTSEQLKAGKRVGDVLINPVSGQPMVRHEPAISEILGLAEV